MMETTAEDYYITKNSWRNLNILYDGININVYKALWRHETVCVKHISFDNEMSKHTKKDIENEVSVLSKCIHPKICQFLGANINNGDAYLLFEYMENGDLVNYMKHNELNNDHRLQIMIDVAKGLCYLHNRKPHIIMHRDLKPQNILIGRYGVAKIADFGISKLVRQTNNESFHGHTGETGTYTWMSPEILKHEEYNFKSDIYSFGLLMYYIWTSKMPFAQYNMNMMQLMYAKFNDSLMLEPFDEEERDLSDLINWCVQIESDTRPEMGEIIEELEFIHNSFSFPK